MTSPATDVFLSYKAEDRARLVPLVEAIEAEGLSVWWDAHIGGGANWREDIQEHLDAAKCVVVVWSKRSVGRDGNFVRDEASRAQRRDAYIPLRIDDVEPPLGFGEIQALSLKGWKGDRADPRFRAAINAIRSHVSGEHVADHSPIAFREPRITRRAAMAGGIGAVAVAGAGGWLLLKPGAAEAKRIAVLPFANLSGSEEQAYFAEGIAEELRSALSRVGMEVIGRASSDAVKDLDTRAAAEKLGVANILSGSVRRSPAMVRINAQLVRGKDGVERWAQSYDRVPGDAIKIQTDIATNVAQALSVALGQAGKAALTLGGTADAAAQDLYLRAKLILNTKSSVESQREAITLLDAAIARDANYADAWRMKAYAWEMMAVGGGVDTAETLVQAEAAAKRAISIAPNLGPAYLPLAFVEVDRLNFGLALQYMDRALQLSPEQLGVISGASVFTEYFGDPRKALELADRVIALDPLRGSGYARRAQVLFTLRDYPRSIAASRRSLQLAPQLAISSANIALCLVLMNRPSEARLEFAKAPADDVLRMTGEAILAARTGDVAAAEQIMNRIREQFGDAASYQYAQICAQAGKVDRAFAELDRAVRIKDPGLQMFKIDPFFDPIHGDSRFAALLKQLNFPAWN
jgi:serine/threonine-protein kinase